MTSGSKTIGSSSTLGPYFVKNWSGGNMPVVPRSPPVYGQPTAYYYYSKSKNGQLVRKLGFHKGRLIRPKKRARALTPHNYTMSLIDSYNAQFDIHIKGEPADKWSTYQTSGLIQVPDTITNNDIISLIGRFGEKLNGGSGFDASVFLGTGHQSLNTITESAVKLAKALSAVKHGRIADAATTLTGKSKGPRFRPVKTQSAMSQSWLELQYGWAPLVKDIYDSGSFLASLLTDPLRFRVKNAIFRDNLPIVSNPGTARCVWASQRGSNRYNITGYFTENPSTIARLGLTNPANLAWELLPWSFVVDWAVPVGDYLNARGVASSLVGTFVSTKVIAGHVSGIAPGPPLGGFTVDGVRRGTAARATSVTMTRTVSSSLSVPPPTFKPLEKVLSWQHCANALALLVGTKTRIENSLSPR